MVPGLLYAESQVKNPDSLTESDFLSWYEFHVTEVLTQAGFLSAVSFHQNAGSPSHLYTYHMTSLAARDAPGFKDMMANSATPEIKEKIYKNVLFNIRFCSEVKKVVTSTADANCLAGVEVPLAQEGEDLLERLTQFPGFLRARLLERKGGAVLDRGVRTDAPTEGLLLMVELGDVEKEAFEKECGGAAIRWWDAGKTWDESEWAHVGGTLEQ